MPVIETVAVRPVASGHWSMLIERRRRNGVGRIELSGGSAAEIEATQREVRRILEQIDYRVPARLRLLPRLDALVLHPISGPLLLAVVLFLMFQAVFSWAKWPMDAMQKRHGRRRRRGWAGTASKGRCAVCCWTA